MKIRTFIVLLALFAVFVLVPGTTDGATFTKANNTTALNADSSWTEAGQPSTNDIAEWNGTVGGDNASEIGGDLTWAGIKISNPGGLVTINDVTASKTLTLGTNGIDMTAATQNLTINAALSLSGTQTWDVQSGRTLSVKGGQIAVNGNILTIQGAGDTTINYNEADISGVGTVIKDGTGTWTTGPGGGGGGGNYTFTGQVWVKQGILKSGRTAFAIDNVANPIVLGDTGTTGTLLSVRGNTVMTFGKDFLLAADGAGKFDMPNDTTLTFSGVISGEGNLIVNGATSRTTTLSGDNTYTGDTYIDRGTVKITNPYLDDMSSVYIASGAKLHLDFTGTDEVGTLYLDGDKQFPGLFDSTNYPAYFVGTGVLEVRAKATVLVIQ